MLGLLTRDAVPSPSERLNDESSPEHQNLATSRPSIGRSTLGCDPQTLELAEMALAKFRCGVADAERSIARNLPPQCIDWQRAGWAWAGVNIAVFFVAQIFRKL